LPSISTLSELIFSIVPEAAPNFERLWRKSS